MSNVPKKWHFMVPIYDISDFVKFIESLNWPETLKYSHIFRTP